MYESENGSKRPFTEMEDENTSEELRYTKPRLGGETPFVNGYMNRWVVRMRGLPYRATRNDVETFFSDVDVVPVQVCFAELRNGRSSGEALVEFDSKENIEKAFKKNKENFLEHDRYIELFDSTPDAIDIVSGAKANIPVEKICDTNTSVVKMRGLPFTAGTKEVEDFLKLKNLDPVRVHHVKDRIGRPAGMCYIELESKEDVDMALTLDRAFMGSRYVEVFASTHIQLAKDVNRGVMTVETQYPGAGPIFKRGRGKGKGLGGGGTFSFGRGYGGSRRGYRGRGRGGLGFNGRGRGMGKGAWISTTVVPPTTRMDRGGRGGYGAQALEQTPWNQPAAQAPWNPNSHMPPIGQQGFDASQGLYQSGPGFQNGPSFHGGAVNQNGPSFYGDAVNQNGPNFHEMAGGYQGGQGFQVESEYQGAPSSRFQNHGPPPYMM